MKKAIFQIPAFDKIDGIAVMDTLSGEPYFIDYEVQTNPSEITLAYSKVSNSAENPLTVFGENEKVAKPRFEKAVSAKLSVQKRISMTLEIDLLKEYDTLTNTLSKRADSISESASIVASAFKHEGIGSGIRNIFNELSKPVSLSDIDLFTENSNVCIFHKLKTAAEYCFPVRFVWGSVMTDTGYFEGRIETLDANINYFSPEWNALRASVNITIKES